LPGLADQLCRQFAPVGQPEPQAAVEQPAVDPRQLDPRQRRRCLIVVVAMAIGVALIFGGYLLARRPVAAPVVATPPMPVQLASRGRAGGSATASGAGAAEGIALISAWLADLDDAAISARCLEWSAAPGDAPALDREQARRAWALRLGLDPAARERFDRLAPAVRRQLAEVHHDVFAADAGSGVRQAG